MTSQFFVMAPEKGPVPRLAILDGQKYTFFPIYSMHSVCVFSLSHPAQSSKSHPTSLPCSTGPSSLTIAGPNKLQPLNTLKKRKIARSFSASPDKLPHNTQTSVKTQPFPRRGCTAMWPVQMRIMLSRVLHCAKGFGVVEYRNPGGENLYVYQND